MLTFEHVSNGGAPDAIAELAQFALDFAIAPTRVLSGQAHDQHFEFHRQTRPPRSWLVSKSPLVAHEISMPFQHGFRSEQEEALAQPGASSPICSSMALPSPWSFWLSRKQPISQARFYLVDSFAPVEQRQGSSCLFQSPKPGSAAMKISFFFLLTTVPHRSHHSAALAWYSIHFRHSRCPAHSCAWKKIRTRRG